MNELLLKSIQLEYETTPQTIDELCRKHKITKTDLGNTSAWVKYNHPILPVIIDSQKPTETLVDNTLVEGEVELVKVKTSIITTSQMLLTEVQNQLTENLMPKDLKDLASVLSAVKDAIVGKEPTTTVIVDNSTNNTMVSYAQEVLKLHRDC